MAKIKIEVPDGEYCYGCKYVYMDNSHGFMNPYCKAFNKILCLTHNDELRRTSLKYNECKQATIKQEVEANV